jgi:hypothetical protein
MKTCRRAWNVAARRNPGTADEMNVAGKTIELGDDECRP